MEHKELSFVMHRIMARTRALVEVLILHRSDLFGAFLTGLGQEAVSAGVMGALLDINLAYASPKSGDHRSQWALALGLDELAGRNCGRNHAFEIMKNHLSKGTASNRGRDSNIHWGCLDCSLLPFLCSDMGRLYPVLVGMAEEIARRAHWRSLPLHERPIGVAFFGEGADQQGVIHETNTWIAASNCVRSDKEIEQYATFYDPLLRSTHVARGSPCFHLVIANQHSIFTDPADEHGNSDLASRAKGYGNMIGTNVDGDDVEAVYAKARDAVVHAQQFISTRIVAKTFRRTGHNEDMIQRDPFVLEEARVAFRKGNWKYEIDWSAGKIENVDPEVFKEAWKRCPLRVHRETLIRAGYAAEELNQILYAAREEMWELFQRAKCEPEVNLEEHRKDYAVLPPFPEWSMPHEKPLTVSKTKRLGYYEAYIEILKELLGSDPRVSVYGQDMRTGGVLAPTRKLAESFGPLRMFNTPITEESAHSNAAGRSLAGGRPIVEVQQFAPFFSDAFSSMLTVVANNYYQKRVKFSFVNVFHCGVVRSGGSGEYHEMMPEGFIQYMQGIVIAAPSNAYDLIGLVRSAHEYDGPVAMLLQIAASNEQEFASEIPEEPYCIPLGKAQVKREGTDFTVIAYGAACVVSALNEAEALAKEGVGVEVIDMRTVWPFDVETFRSSIKKTGRFCVFQEDRASRGVGNILVSQLVRGKESVLPSIQTQNIEVIGARDMPIPSRKALVWDRLPYELIDVEARDAKGRVIRKSMHRSSKLVNLIRESLR